MSSYSRRIAGGRVFAFWATPIAIGVVLIALFSDPSYLQNDAAQYISGARNLVAGHGYATDLIYYDSQYQTGDFPAPQTVFPPGYSFLIASLNVLGLDASLAAIAVSFLSLCLIAALLHMWLRQSGVPAVVSGVAALMQLTLMSFWSNALQGQSEAPYTLFTVLSLFAVSCSVGRDGERWPLLLAAGLAAAAAMATRYQGIFFALSLGLVFSWRWVRNRNQANLLALLLVAGPPSLVAALLFLRNHLVSVNLMGGPISTANDFAGPGEVISLLIWEMSRLFGFSRAGFLAWRPAEIGLSLFAGLLVIVTVAVIRDARRNQGARGALPAVAGSNPVLGVSWAYVVISLVGLVWLTFSKSIAYMQDRFLLTLAPVILYLLGVFFSKLARARPRSVLRSTVAAFGLLVYLLGQVHAGNFYLDDQAEQKRRYLIIEEALASRLMPDQPGSVARFLTGEIDSGRHLFALESQRTGLILGRGVFGPAPALFTDSDWGERRVACLIADYDIRYVIHYPSLFDPERGQFSTSSIIADLHTGIVPNWLTFKSKNRNLVMYEVDGEAPCEGDHRQ